MEFNEKLEAWMTEVGMSQYRLADELQERYGLKTGRSQVRKWVSGEGYPNAAACACMEDMMGASWAYLYFDNPWPPPPTNTGVRLIQELPAERRAFAYKMLRDLAQLE